MNRQVWNKLLLLSVLVLTLVGCVPREPTVLSGTAVLTTTAGNRSPLRLDGDWEFWWSKDVTDPTRLPESYMAVPGYWKADNHPETTSRGVATYGVQLRTPPGEGHWGLQLPDISSAWKLTVNGKQIAQQGTPTFRDSKALMSRRVVELPESTDGRYDVFLFIANHADRVGGIRDSILFGKAEVLSQQAKLDRLFSALLVGALVVMTIVNAMFFVVQKENSANLWLAVFSFLIALRSAVSGPRILMEFFPQISFEWGAHVAFMGVLGGAAAFVMYLRKIFPDFWPGKVFVPFLMYTGIFVVLLPFLPVDTYAEAFLTLYDPVLFVVVAVMLGVVIWATIQKARNGTMVLAGMVFLLLGAVNDILYQYISLPQGDVLGTFLFIFLVFNTVILGRQFGQTFSTNKRQADELKELDKLKDDFLARVSHELRTPLHGMLGILDAFSNGDLGTLSERQRYHMGLLGSSNRRLLGMVNDILDFSQSKKLQEPRDPRPIRVHELVDLVLPALRPLVRPEVEIANRVGPDLPAALGDESLLEQVLHHLIRNALQHTQKGTVIIESEVRDQSMTILIRDSGEGIAADRLSQLFSPFHQTSELNTRATGGLGLGLAVSQQSLQSMGGKLEVRSREGNGTTVLVTIPLCPPSRVQYFQKERISGIRSETPVPHVGRYSLPSPVLLPKDDQMAEPDDGVGRQERGLGSTVLIVDDEPVNLLVLKTFLGRQGYRVLEADNGQGALEIVNHQVVDLIILDVMMPGMSGYQVCEEVRKQFSPARLPIIFLTAKNQMSDLLHGYDVGASEFLTKPFQRDELKARLDLHLGVSKAARSGNSLVPPNA